MSIEQLQGSERDDEADSDLLMDALDVLFHVSECPHHSDDERRAAYQAAREAYFTLITDEGDVPDEHANAPTSNRVH